MNLRVGIYALVIGILVGCGGSKDREQQYLEKAKTYVQENNSEKARVELKNVLQMNPKNAEARFLMAKLAEKDQDWQKMFEFLSALIQDQPDHLDAQIKLGSLFLLSGDVQKATEKVELVLAKQPENIQALVLKAAIAVRNHDKSGAEALLQKALSLEPNNLEAVYLLSKFYAENQSYDKAIQVIDGVLSQHPDEINLAMLKVQILALLNKQSEAEIIALDLLKRFPDNNLLHYGVAKHYIQIHQADKAEQVLQQLISKRPTETEPKLALIDFYLSQKNPAKAEQALLTFIKDNPNQYELNFTLAGLYKDKPEDAIKVLNQIIAADGHGPNALKAKNILANYAQMKGDKKQSLELVEQIIADDPHNADALMLRSTLMLEQGKYDDAIADLRTVLRDQPNSEKALILSANTHMQSGYIDLAQEALENVLAVNPSNNQVRKDLARMFVQKNDPERAITLLESTGQSPQRDFEKAAMLVDLYLMTKNWEKAEATAKSIASIEKTGLSQIKLAQVYFAQQKYPSALTAYQEALKLKPLSIEALGGMTDTYLVMGEAAKAGTELDKLLEKNPNHVDLLNMRGLLFKNQKQLSQAERVFSKIVQLKKEADFGYYNLASVLLMQNQAEQALAVYQKGLNELPNNTKLLFGKAELYEKISKYQEAIDLYKQILKFSPQNTIAANNLAAVIANTTEDPKQLSEAFELVKNFKESKEPALLDTYGWLSFLNGQVDTATSVLERVIEKEPNLVDFNYHLGMVYAAKGRTEEAKRLLQKALASSADFPGKSKASAKLAELGGT